MPGAALVIALLTPPSLTAAPIASLLAQRSSASAEAWRNARLIQWGAQVRWDDRWRAFVSPETPGRAVVPVWERFETPSIEPDAPAPSYIVMREMDCGQHVWRTTGVVSFPAANLNGEAHFEPSNETWRPAERDSAEAGLIYGSVCRR